MKAFTDEQIESALGVVIVNFPDPVDQWFTVPAVDTKHLGEALSKFALEERFESPHRADIGIYGQSSADGWVCRSCGWQMSGGVGTPRESIERQHDSDRGLTSKRFERVVGPWVEK